MRSGAGDRHPLVFVRSGGVSRRIVLAGPWLCLLSWTEPVAADRATTTFVVVANRGVSVAVVERTFLADAFLKNRTRWPSDDPIRPVDQSYDSPVRKAFSEAVLKRSVAAVKNYWQQRIFSGRGVPPPALDGDAAVIDYVASHGGSVGYVSAGAALGETRVLTVKG